MRQFGYPQSFATNMITAGGSLAAMIPPSAVFAVYNLFTEQDIGKRFMVRIIPGLIAVGMYIATINLLPQARLSAQDAVPKLGGAARGLGGDPPVHLHYRQPLCRDVHRYRGGRQGAGGPPSSSQWRGRELSYAAFWACAESLRNTAAVFTSLIAVFNLCLWLFRHHHQVPQRFTAFCVRPGLAPYGMQVLILLMYLVLGCIMDAMAMIILTVPTVFPVI